ncbi:MAG: hypothetical protein WC683_19270 [bacterium]
MTELVTDIRDGLAANLAALTGYGVFSYVNPGAPLPAIWVYPDEIEFNESVGTDTRQFIIEARLGSVSERSAQENADALMGNGTFSIRKALESDTLAIGDGEWQVNVTKCSGYRYDAQETLIVQWTVELSTPNLDT